MPISFPTVSTGLIYKTTTCIDEFTLNKNIAIGGKITTSDMCQFYSRSPVLHPSQKHVEIQNNGLSTTAWLTMAEAIKDISCNYPTTVFSTRPICLFLINDIFSP